MGASQADYLVPPVSNPGASQYATVFDTGDGGYLSYVGLVGALFFDQPVTVLVEVAPPAGALRVMNGNGAGEVVAANTPEDLRVVFTGARTRVRILTGATPPSVWFVTARVTEGGVV